MFSLQRILGKEDKFFSLLEASARQAHTSVQALVRLSKALDQQPPVLDEFTDSRRKDKEITKEITEAVYTTFVTALEREDIDALSTALYKITKSVDKFSQRAVLAPQHVRGIDFSTQISLCDRATATLHEMVHALRDGMDLEKMRDLNEKLQYLEGEADRHMVELYRDLFNGQHPPLQVIFLKDLYELLERVIDRCRDAGNILSHIVLKNS